MALRRRDFLGAVVGGGFLSTLPIGRLAAQTTETWAQSRLRCKKGRDAADLQRHFDRTGCGC